MANEKQQSRSPFKVTSTFEAYKDQANGYDPDPMTMEEGWAIFADPAYWKGEFRDGQEIVKFFCNQNQFYVDRGTFEASTHPIRVEPRPSPEST